MFSPIRADRWSCGRVLLELLRRLGERVQSFAKRLMNVDPCHRPSLLDWDDVEGGGNAKP